MELVFVYICLFLYFRLHQCIIFSSTGRSPAELLLSPCVRLSVCLSVTLCISLNSKAICTKLYQCVAHKNTSRRFFHFFDSTSKMAATAAILNFCRNFVRTTPPEPKVIEIWGFHYWLQLTLYMCPF